MPHSQSYVPAPEQLPLSLEMMPNPRYSNLIAASLSGK